MSRSVAYVCHEAERLLPLLAEAAAAEGETDRGRVLLYALTLIVVSAEALRRLAITMPLVVDAALVGAATSTLVTADASQRTRRDVDELIARIGAKP